MSLFERIATALNLSIQTDKHGQYTGKTAALFVIVNNLIFYGNYDDDELKTRAISRFYECFPYMRNA